MRYNTQQRAYSQALRSSEMAEARAAAHERAFLEARGATDRRGLPARRLWQVDALEAEYQADPVSAELQSTEMAARAALIKAEKALVAWALSIVPAGVRATLAPAAETNRATRKKIIDLAMRLDASTVSRRVV